MSEVSKDEMRMVSKSLALYYEALKGGDLNLFSSIMTRESYFIMLESFGFKHSLKDENFRKTLKNIDKSEDALHQVEEVISADLKASHREHKIQIREVEPNGPNRIILYYLEDEHPKKLYFSSSHGMWKIDYKAGRKVN